LLDRALDAPQRLWSTVASYFMGDDPTFWVAMVPMLILSAALFTRSLQSNYIFDEQEALLANPYVNGKSLAYRDAVKRDFWGLPPDRSVGSYRPLPNYVWRGVWEAQQFATNNVNRVVQKFQAQGSPPPPPPAMQPWIFHWLNVLLHAANGAMMVCFTFALTRRRGLSWLAGVIFVTAAVLTEAISGVVGIADVMGGMGALFALLALRLPMWAMPLGVFAGVMFGLFSKESALVCVPLVPFAALIFAPLTHPRRPWRALRTVVASLACIAALVAYVKLRKYWFPAPEPAELSAPLDPSANLAAKAMHAFHRWFHQAPLPKDPLNNPFVQADFPHRVAGALRVFWRGLTQVVFPWNLSGDYSAPQEPTPKTLTEPETILGGLAMAGLPLASIALTVTAWVRERRWRRIQAPHDPGAVPAPQTGLPILAMFAAVGLMWIVVAYFPHSNIPVLLPTVRAERFWYFPVIGSSLALAAFFVWLFDRTRHIKAGAVAVGLFSLFIVFQSARARLHAFDYKDDLVFWDATRHAVPFSAKAHLNYSVMWGARGRLDIREQSNRVALKLAPSWPMAHIYLGDTLCRLHRPDEAWPHYRNGFLLAPGDPNLIALALQCLWDEGALEKHRAELEQAADANPGSWLAYLAHDTLNNGEKNKGVDPKYRPRGYNEGPKE
jgi:hypothetical protein